MVMARSTALGAVLAAALFCVSYVHANDRLGALIQAHVEYVNGGIGQEEADELRTDPRTFPLAIEFSRRGEGERAEFLADIHLLIVDSVGHVVIDRSAGPIFLAQLPDGQYTISAEYQGRLQTRRVVVQGGRHQAVSFYWS